MMKFHSPSMKPFLNQIDSLETKKLPAGLQQILDMGFTKNHGGVFFNQFFSNTVLTTLISQNYLDLSGYEFTTNKFHIEDYCDDLDPFNVALHFIDVFSDKWRLDFQNRNCNACISFQDDADFGKAAVFSFYLERQDQVVIDVRRIDTFEEPIYVVQVGGS